MKTGFSISILAVLLFSSSAVFAKSLVCELEDSLYHRVIDSNAETLDHAHILLLLGNEEVMATVRDVANAETGDRKIELNLSYQGGEGVGHGNAQTTYVAATMPLETTLAQASIELAPNERRYSLRCFLR